jgi:hypothetical protein
MANDKNELKRRGKIINIFSKRRSDLAEEIIDSETDSLYQSILFLELFSMEAFRVGELIRHSDEGDAHYYDLVDEKAKLMLKIEEERDRITVMGMAGDYDTTDFTEGPHPEWECEVLQGSFGHDEEQ